MMYMPFLKITTDVQLLFYMKSVRQKTFHTVEVLVTGQQEVLFYKRREKEESNYIIMVTVLTHKDME